MFNKYILLLPSGFLLKKYINSVNKKESYNQENSNSISTNMTSTDSTNQTNNKVCSLNLTKALHKNIHLPIIKEIQRVLSQEKVSELIKCIYDSNCDDLNNNIPFNLLKINIPELNNWKTKTIQKEQDEEFNLIIEKVSSNISKDMGIDIPILSKIIGVYLKEVYINIVDRYNSGLTMKICKTDINKDKLKFCDQLINKLVSLLPQYEDNMKYLEVINSNQPKDNSNQIKTTVLEQALLNVYSKFNNISLSEEDKLKIQNCKLISEIPNIKNIEVIEKINSIKLVKSDDIDQSRLDKLTNDANIREKRKQIADLTLREIIYNTNSTILKLLQLLSTLQINNDYKITENYNVNNSNNSNNLNNIITFLKEDDNLFYIGVFLIAISLMMYAMKN